MQASPAEAYRGDTTRVIADVRRWLSRPVAGGAGHRGPRPGPAAGRVAEQRGRGRTARRGRGRRAARGGHRARGDGDHRARLHLADGAAHGADRGRPGRPARRGRRARADADPAARRDRPAAAGPWRLRGARAARRRPVPGDDQPHGVRGDPGVPGHRVRAEQAGPAARPAVPAHRPARRGHQVLRWRGAQPAPARRRRLGQDQGPGPPGGARDRRRADPAVLGTDRLARPRVRAGHAVAARAGGRVPLRRDAGPAGRHRRGQARHGEAGADGPADLRRRGLRQDRDRGAGRVQGGAGRQAGGRARAHHAAGPAAHGHVQRAVRAVPGGDQADVAVPERRRGRRHPGRPGRGQGRRGDRHAPAAVRRRPGSGSSGW